MRDTLEKEHPDFFLGHEEVFLQRNRSKRVLNGYQLCIWLEGGYSIRVRISELNPEYDNSRWPLVNFDAVPIVERFFDAEAHGGSLAGARKHAMNFAKKAAEDSGYLDMCSVEYAPLEDRGQEFTFTHVEHGNEFRRPDFREKAYEELNKRYRSGYTPNEVAASLLYAGWKTETVMAVERVLADSGTEALVEKRRGLVQE